MNSSYCLKFFYQDDLVYETSATLSEEQKIIGSSDILCILKADYAHAPSSFGYNRVEVYSYSKMVYWFSFQETKYVLKSNKEKINVSYYRKQNSISFIMED
jgi:hypothetical protein